MGCTDQIGRFLFFFFLKINKIKPPKLTWTTDFLKMKNSQTDKHEFQHSRKHKNNNYNYKHHIQEICDVVALNKNIIKNSVCFFISYSLK